MIDGITLTDFISNASAFGMVCMACYILFGRNNKQEATIEKLKDEKYELLRQMNDEKLKMVTEERDAYKKTQEDILTKIAEGIDGIAKNIK